MAHPEVTVVARIRAKKGLERRVKAELLALIVPTRAEKGCIIYDLHLSADDPGLFMFYENWTSREALDQHMGMPYLKAFLAKEKEILDGPAEVTLWEKIS